MSLEIERKFLLSNDNWKKHNPEGIRFCQGYIPTGNNTTVRIRIAGEQAFITIKSTAVNITRNEFEYKIPLNDAKMMLHILCSKPLIEKIRYKLEYRGKVWEIDVFERDNEGLIIAEIELQNEAETFEIPEWVGIEVTGDPKYYNAGLVQYPYYKWTKEEKENKK